MPLAPVYHPLIKTTLQEKRAYFPSFLSSALIFRNVCLKNAKNGEKLMFFYI
jgi:hypothetical protein